MIDVNKRVILIESNVAILKTPLTSWELTVVLLFECLAVYMWVTLASAPTAVTVCHRYRGDMRLGQ